MRVSLSHDFAEVRKAAAEVRVFLEAQGLCEADIWACELALVEGCNNAIQHVQRSALSEHIVLEVQCSSSKVKLSINDHTGGFEMPSKFHLPQEECERGRGLFLISRLMDEMEYVRRAGTNSLVLQKNRTCC